MLTITKEIKLNLNRFNSLEGKVKYLKNKYNGEKCYILTAGPSINNFTKEYLKERLKNNLVIAVKQTYNIVPEICDFHLLNTWNLQRYNYPKKTKPIILMERRDRDPITYGDFDLIFKVPNNFAIKDRLCENLNFDDFLFDETLIRPWGPGIMYELAFYLAVHIGVSEITTLGWDLGVSNSSIMPHFFDTDVKSNKTNQKETLIEKILMKLPQRYRNYYLHKFGYLYNKPPIREVEVDEISKSTKFLYQWLNTKGIDLKIISDISLVDEIVPRIAL